MFLLLFCRFYFYSLHIYTLHIHNLSKAQTTARERVNGPARTTVLCATDSVTYSYVKHSDGECVYVGAPWALKVAPWALSDCFSCLLCFVCIACTAMLAVAVVAVVVVVIVSSIQRYFRYCYISAMFLLLLSRCGSKFCFQRTWNTQTYIHYSQHNVVVAVHSTHSIVSALL